MTPKNNRTFSHRPAARERVPLLVGLVGPSGGGKTYSALRLATGIQRVSGGKIFVIDTEARRALHYADDFAFEHIDFAAPFGSLDYLAAAQYAVEQGAGVIVIDSMSHEHEGPGGLLETHEAEAERLAKAWKTSVEKAKMSAWAKPKAARRRLINTMLQLPVNFVLCFRAKEKLKIKKGQDPQPLGWMAIAGPEFVFEMNLSALLLPGAGGVPAWHSEEIGERETIKLPGWARGIVPTDAPFDEETGERLAQWAAGTKSYTVQDLLAAYAECVAHAQLGALGIESRKLWDRVGTAEKKALKEAALAAKARIEAAEKEAELTVGTMSAEDEATARAIERGEE